MAEWWDARNTRWHELFEAAVESVSSRRLSEAVSRLDRVGSWQRRQTRHGTENHFWHDAEVLWLRGVALERARRRALARATWTRLARLYAKSVRRPISSFEPYCLCCGERELSFSPNWAAAARMLREVTDRDERAIAAALSSYAQPSSSLGRCDQALKQRLQPATRGGNLSAPRLNRGR